MNSWFKSHQVEDKEGFFGEVSVLFRLAIDDEGLPIVFTECYVQKYDHWYEEITSFSSEESACDFIYITTKELAENWLDRAIEQQGLPLELI